METRNPIVKVCAGPGAYDLSDPKLLTVLAVNEFGIEKPLCYGHSVPSFISQSETSDLSLKAEYDGILVYDYLSNMYAGYKTYTNLIIKQVSLLDSLINKDGTRKPICLRVNHVPVMKALLSDEVKNAFEIEYVYRGLAFSIIKGEEAEERIKEDFDIQ